MSLDSTTDTHLEALLELAVGGVNANLSDDLGRSAVDGAYNHPRPLALVSRLELPALAVYRYRERKSEAGQFVDDVVTFRFEYVATPASLENLGDRWPILRAVWAELVGVVCDGSHPSVADGGTILEDAGFVEVDVDSARVEYSFHPDGQTLYPFFRGEMVLTHRPIENVSGLEDLTSLDASYEPPDFPALEQPLVEDIADV